MLKMCAAVNRTYGSVKSSLSDASKLTKKFFSLLKSQDPGAIGEIKQILGSSIGRSILNAKDENGETALIIAERFEDPYYFKFLVNRFGINLNQLFSHGESLMTLAVSSGNISTVRSIWNSGADANFPNRSGKTPFMIAAEKGFLDIVEFFLTKHSTKLDLQNKDGETALMLATKSGRFEIVDTLISYGADPNVLNKAGKTALNIRRNIIYRTTKGKKTGLGQGIHNNIKHRLKAVTRKR